MVRIDNINPWLPFIKADTQSWLIASLTGIFLIFICFGCIFFFVHVGCLRIDPNVIYLRRGSGSERFSLLSEREVLSLPEVQYEENCEKIQSYYVGSCCSICLEDFSAGQTLRELQPCKHLFHTGCILPWLTERQPFCPLCKTQVIVQEQHRNYNSISGRSLTNDSLVSSDHHEEVDNSLILSNSTDTNDNNRQLFLQRLRYWAFNHWWNNENDRIRSNDNGNEEERLLLPSSNINSDTTL